MDFDEDFEDIPAVDDSMTAEEREVEIQLLELQMAGLQTGALEEQDDEEDEPGNKAGGSRAIESESGAAGGERAIEISAGGSGAFSRGPGMVTLPTAQVDRLLERQECLRLKLQLLEKKRELEEKLRRQQLQLLEEQRVNRPRFEHLTQVGDGFWNIRGAFRILAGMLNLGTHMSVCRRASGRFVIIDTCDLPPDALVELNLLTHNGELIDAVIATHPYHTLAFRAFYAAFPKCPYYGTPRHLNTIPEIPWQGEIMSNKDLFSPDLDFRIPAGAEYVLPLPARSNHLSNVFVLHKQSKTIHNDDCVLCIEHPPVLMRLMGYKNGDMHFHPSLKGPGLYPTPEAPIEFQRFIELLIDEWDFDNICSAHNGNCLGGAKNKLRQTLRNAESTLQKISNKNSQRKPPKDCGSWSSDPKDPAECG